MSWVLFPPALTCCMLTLYLYAVAAAAEACQQQQQQQQRQQRQQQTAAPEQPLAARPVQLLRNASGGLSGRAGGANTPDVLDELFNSWGEEGLGLGGLGFNGLEVSPSGRQDETRKQPDMVWAVACAPVTLAAGGTAPDLEYRALPGHMRDVPLWPLYATGGRWERRGCWRPGPVSVGRLAHGSGQPAA